MKKAAEAFLIVGMVLTFWLIFPLVLGIIAYIKLQNSKDQKELQQWGIISLIFVSLLGGIFYLEYVRSLNFSNYEFEEDREVFRDDFKINTVNKKINNINNNEDMFLQVALLNKKFKNLLKEGIISQDEYNCVTEGLRGELNE